MLNSSLRRIRGFSLIELIVTVSILVLVIVVAVPDLTVLLRTSRLSNETDGLIGVLNLARVEAIRTKSDTAVCAMSNPLSDVACSVNAAHWSNGWAVVSNGNVIRRITPGDGVTVGSVSPAVVFNGTIGGATAASTITLCSRGLKRQQVSVGMSGAVSKSIETSVTCS